jgi:ubiquinone/menaquinone biosynthesis C-methylase UbiE/uncharacterized protein YbaR (Trm112 family)
MALLRNDLLEILVCPQCRARLQLYTLSVERKAGILTCRNGHFYPIIDGLPRMLVGALRDNYADFLNSYKEKMPSIGHALTDNRERLESKQVKDVFSEKWLSKDIMGVADSSPYKIFMRQWMLKKYGWSTEAGFNDELRNRKMILDAGAGLGREVINMASASPNSTVVGIEFSDCATSAMKNISGLSNACLIQGDILRMPFKSESFDFILSEGVLHHTPDTQEAFESCCKVLKTGGEFAFYVYRKKGPVREFTDDHLRKVMQEIQPLDKWRFAEQLTKLGKTLSEIRAEVEIQTDMPELGIKKTRTSVHMFVYQNFLKCFWNNELPFEENVIVNFDWFAPQHAHRHTEAEIRSWCEEKNIEIIWFHEEHSGYAVRGIKK